MPMGAASSIHHYTSIIACERRVCLKIETFFLKALYLTKAYLLKVKRLRGTIQLAFPWIPRTSWKFCGEFSWIPRPSWIPWKFRGIHENFVDSMKTSWIPWKPRGLHENFVESMETSWIP